jgi:activator of 2-hydroxyglutaryl-CoA dehydratase
VSREVISTALHNSIVTRILPLVKRIGLVEDIVFAGGCARDACLRRMLAERLGKRVLVHDNPEMLSAYGAALCILDRIS